MAWKVLFGVYVTVPQGPGYLDWSSPHLRDVLFSANHGLFATSPALLLGLLGLVLHLRRDPALAGGALLTLAALAWTNGAVADWDWEGGDAFGARRFDVAVPLLAVGLAALRARRPRPSAGRSCSPRRSSARWPSGTSASWRSSAPGGIPRRRPSTASRATRPCSGGAWPPVRSAPEPTTSSTESTSSGRLPRGGRCLSHGPTTGPSARASHPPPGAKAVRPSGGRSTPRPASYCPCAARCFRWGSACGSVPRARPFPRS